MIKQLFYRLKLWLFANYYAQEIELRFWRERYAELEKEKNQ